MRCPHCGFGNSKVTDSRANPDGIRRRRECVSCGQRFTTIEAVQLSSVQIIKKDGRREDFNREKLVVGFRVACAKRNISVAEIETLAVEIEAKVMADGRPEVPSSLIGEMAMDALRNLDHIAYIRFASVYRSFADLDSLKGALDALESGRELTIDERDMQLELPVDGEGERRGEPVIPRSAGDQQRARSAG